jgi:nicotinate-nucleotide--dimethylbenzimidazole phosphoribosyltransferase
VLLGCRAARVPVVLDGFITGAAALVAAAIEPASVEAMIAGHRSPEPGHSLVLERLGLEPLLDLRLRLGEGSGAALAMPIVRGALALLNEMASFDEAGVTDAGR